MARLRWVLVLLALGIGLPAVLIVQRASEALELENAHRHETVAERVFDEMERSLSDFLVREESRPASDYDDALALLSGEGAKDSAVSLPTRFEGADEPFIIGWFVLLASGEPRAVAAEPSARGRIESAMRSALASPPTKSRRELGQDEFDRERMMAKRQDEKEADLPAPGRTSAVGRARLTEESLADLDTPAPEEPSAYEVLQNLNRAGSLRSERQSKALRKRAAPRKAEARFGTENEPTASAPAPGDAFLSRPALDDEAEAPSPATSTRPVLDPLVGRITEGGALVLTRSVWRGPRVDRQGLVLDRRALIEWIGQRVLGETGLEDRAALDFAPYSQEDQDAEYRYVHRFAEPFDDLVARLELEPLPPLGASRSIPALAALLAVALIVGLVAVDRMTRVVIEYAERRGNFVAAVSHELRTPLTAIRMYAEMLRDGLVSSEDKRKEYYTTITDESERLSRLIDNVLEFSRLEQDRRKLELVTTGLCETVRRAAAKLETHAEREGFRLALDLPETLPRVRYDQDAVTQIVFNLVDNALKYARDPSQKTIEIRLSAIDDPKTARGVELRVRDYGPGIPGEQSKRIFEPFYRIGDELTRTTEGTGIGLALVRELATGMGGSVRAENPAGGGLEIIVTLAPE